MHVFVTGVAGFIGANCARQLLDQGHSVTGIDNLNDYYDVSLKQARLAALTEHQKFQFIEGAISIIEYRTSSFSISRSCFFSSTPFSVEAISIQ